MFRTLQSWLGTSARRPAPARLALEAMDRRDVPAVFTVTNLADAGPGSLRSAVARANAADGPDAIAFDPDLAGTIVLRSGELVVTDAVNVRGPGPEQLAVSGNDASRVFDVASGAGDVRIAGLTLKRGAATDGGAVRTASGTDLVLANCVVTRNAATSKGGGVSAAGGLDVRGCTITDNEAGWRGGGVYVGGRTTAAVAGSTLAGNRAAGGGGLAADQGSAVTLRNSTVSGNAATETGGGLRTFQGTLTVESSTIDHNAAGTRGGGVYAVANLRTVGGQDYTAVTVRNSTVSANTAAVGAAAVIEDTLHGTGSTLLVQNSTIAFNAAADAGDGVVWLGGVDATFVSSLFAGQDDDLIGGTPATARRCLFETDPTYYLDPAASAFNKVNADARLAPLADNGGPTRTHALLAGSDAIDAGSNPDGLTADQRGTARVKGDRIDIGAYER